MNSIEDAPAVPKPDDPTQTANASHPVTGPPTPATPVTTADEGTVKTAQGAGLVIGGIVLAGIASMAFFGLGDRNEELERLLYPPKLVPSPEPPPSRPSEPIPAPLGPVTDRPKSITYLWCWRCAWRTGPQNLKVVVPSASSRSQYIRIATRIDMTWGRELDARGVSFEVMRWIAAARDFLECQDRYLRVLSGERPRGLKAPKPVNLPTALLRSQKRRPTLKGRPARTMACASTPEETPDDAPPPPTACHRRASRRRWQPNTTLVCGEGAQEEYARVNADIYKQVEELFRTQGTFFPPKQIPRPDSSCLPQVECSRRRSRRVPTQSPPLPKLRGRQRLPGDHEWGW